MNKLRNKFNKLGALVLAAVAVGAMQANAALSDVVSYASGEVTFAPSNVVTPVITGIIAAIGAAAAIFVIVVGIRWIYRTAKSSK